MRSLSAAAVALACTTFAGAFQPTAVRVGAPSPLTKSAPASFRPLSMVATGEDIEAAKTPEVVSNLMATAAPPPPFGKVMAANRAEIAVRIVRACIELNMATGEFLLVGARRKVCFPNSRHVVNAFCLRWCKK
jgi:hypothetical protein